MCFKNKLGSVASPPTVSGSATGSSQLPLQKQTEVLMEHLETKRKKQQEKLRGFYVANQRKTTKSQTKITP